MEATRCGSWHRIDPSRVIAHGVKPMDCILMTNAPTKSTRRAMSTKAVKGRMGAMTIAMIRFLTRRGCPLCDEAYALVESLTATSDINVEVVDIDLDLELLDLYDERVPVLLDSEGTVIAEGQMTERETARVLRD